jgi:type VI protein secretion system component VasK
MSPGSLAFMNNGMMSYVATSLNPLIPSSTDWLVTGIASGHILLWIAIVLWLLRQQHLDAGQRLLGLVLATVLPVIGPLLVWWSARRPRQSASSVDGDSRG